MSELVVVYGTLKQGYGNNERCLAYSKFLGEVISLNANYKMYGGGGVPILLEGGDARVKGELFEVSPEDFAACDNLEGHPASYRREKREFVLLESNPSAFVTAWVYLWPHGANGKPNKIINGVIEWRPKE